MVRIIDDQNTDEFVTAYPDVEAIPPEYAYTPATPVDDTGRPRFVGDAEHIRSDIEEYEKAGVEQFTLRFWTTFGAATPQSILAQMARFAAEFL